MNRFKVSIDCLAIAGTVVCIVTGVMLHIDVWHRFVYDNTLLWGIHEVVGLLMIALVAFHCWQHSAWFKNYGKIPVAGKRVTSLFLVVAVVVAVTGVVLFCGSRSHLASRLHYISGILFTLFAAGHVAKRFKILKALMKLPRQR